jgi:hypothetical protein
MAIWYNVWPFGIVWVIRYIFSQFGMFGPRKIWQPWLTCAEDTPIFAHSIVTTTKAFSAFFFFFRAIVFLHPHQSISVLMSNKMSNNFFLHSRADPML